MKGRQPFASWIRKWLWEAGLIVILPLLFWHGFAEQFTTPKLFLAKILIITGLAVWGLEWTWKRALRVLSFRPALPLLVLSLSVLISCLNSPIPRYSLMEAEFFLCGPACALLLVAWNRGESAVRRILALAGLAGSSAAIVTLLQWLQFDPVLLGGYQVDWGSMVTRMRLYSTFGNPNYAAGYLIGTIFAALLLTTVSKSYAAKVAWLTGAAIMLIAIVITGSRAAWLGLVVGVAAAGTVFMKRGLRYQSQMSRSYRAAEQRIGFMVPVALWPLGLLSLSWAERLADQFRGRIYLWQFSWPMFWQHPWMGSGWGTYQLSYLDLQAKFLSTRPELVGYWTNNRLLHNDPLQLLIEAGVLGFAALIGLLAVFFWQALQVARESREDPTRFTLAATVGGVAAILTDSLFNYQFAVPPTCILLFTLLAIPFMLEKRNLGADEAMALSPPVPARNPLRRFLWKVAASVAIAGVAGGLLWQQVRWLESEHLYQVAYDLESRHDFGNAEKTFRRSVAHNDLNGRAHFGLSRVLLAQENFSNSLVEIAKAERTYTDSHQEILRGQILMQMGKPGEALEAYRHAEWLDPTLGLGADHPPLNAPTNDAH